MHENGKKQSKFRGRLWISAVAGLLMAASIPVRAGEIHRLGLGTGIVGIMDHEKSVYGCIEYRSPAQFYRMRPWLSVEFSDHFFYGAAGLLVDFNLTEHLAITPSFGAGVYSQDNGIRLGHPIEFRSAAELSWQFGYSGRLAVSFGHISNGGLDDTNPGSELLKITWLFPLDFH